ncbi:MAG: MFS transporter [Acetobacteraceae bacterium]|nr:MFS transporter [Acetobacteraceae bacterium]
MTIIQSPLFRFLVLYALIYAAFGVQSPFLPALLQERGLHPDAIAVILASSTAIRVLAGPLVGHAADRLQRHPAVLRACIAAAALAGTGYALMQGAPELLLVGLCQAAALAPVVPLSDALATTSAHLSQSAPRGYRFDYSLVRGAGSAAFISGILLSGWAVQKSSLIAIIWLSSMLLMLACSAGFGLPAIPSERGAGNTAAIFDPGDLVLLLRIKAFRSLLLTAALVEGSHALHDSFAVIRWQAAGLGPVTIGVLWSESVAAEVVVFLLLGQRLIGLLGPAGACALSAGAGVLRWVVMALTTSPIALALVEPLHGLTFALLHLACMQLIVRVTPFSLAGTAQSIYGTLCVGLATAAVTLASGALYETLGGAAFLVMAALCAMALPVCRGLRLGEKAHVPNS